MRRLARTIALTVVATVAAAASIVAPALAAPTKVTWPVTINVRAAPGTENRIKITYGPAPFRLPFPITDDISHFIFDNAGITTKVTEPPTCYPKGPKTVSCPDGAPGQGESFSIFLGDGDDVFTAEFSLGDFEVHAGSGDDKVAGARFPSITVGGEEQVRNYTEDSLYGDRGNDYLLGWAGPDLLSGGSGNDRLIGGYAAGRDDFGVSADTLRGGPGNDYLDASTHEFGADPPKPERDLVIDCGPGRRDRALIDRVDPKPKGCESVKRVKFSLDFAR